MDEYIFEVCSINYDDTFEQQAIFSTEEEAQKFVDDAIEKKHQIASDVDDIETINVFKVKTGVRVHRASIREVTREYLPSGVDDDEHLVVANDSKLERQDS